MSPTDFSTQQLNRQEARKLLAKIVGSGGQIIFKAHALKRIPERNLTTVDVINVLKSTDAKIISDGELVDGTFRYRLETSKILVVVAFGSMGDYVIVVSTWYKEGRRRR